MLSRLLLALALIANACAWAGNEATPPSEQDGANGSATATGSVLTLAGSRNLPPFSMLAEDGEPAGVGVELWRLWSQKTGRPIRFRLTDIARSLTDLETGRADFHSGLFYSKERGERLSFSKPFLRAPATLYFLFDDAGPRKLDDFKTARIGVQGPPPQELFQRLFPQAEPKSFENIPQMIAAANRGDIDAFLADRPSADLALVRSGLRGDFSALDQDLFQVELRAAVPKGQEALLAEIERGLDAISQDELKAILDRWLGASSDKAIYLPRRQDVELSPAERDWIERHKTLRIAVDPDFAPFEFVEDGRHRGVSADFLSLLSARLGLSFEVVPTANWRESVAKGSAKEVDVLPMLNRTAERERFLLFTEPYFVSQQAVIARRQRDDIRAASDLAGKTLTLPAGYSIREELGDLSASVRID